MKKVLYGVLIFLNVFNVIKYEIYMLLNPSVLMEQTSEDTPVSAVDYNSCKAKGTNPLKEIGKVLHSINLCPVFYFEARLDNNLEIAIYHFPLDPNPDSGQLNIHLRI
jgi:hypothetical protein